MPSANCNLEGLYGISLDGEGGVDELDLSQNMRFNRFGGISPELGNLTNLKVLNLSKNNFIIGIPAELGNLILSVEQNQKTEYNATRVRLNEGFSAKAGADFKVRSSGCD